MFSFFRTTSLAITAFTVLKTRVTAFLPPTKIISRRASNSGTTLRASDFLETASEAVSASLNRDIKLEPTTGGGFSGGGGATTAVAIDPSTNTKYFIKSAPLSSGGGKMLRAEYLGVKEMSETGTIRVPTPVAYGEGGASNLAFVVFEYLEFTSGGSEYDLGRNLARMHRAVSPDGCFGFHVDNTIGATPQPNLPFEERDWAEFWDVFRLGHMLKLCGNVGLDAGEITKLREKTKVLLSHEPPASLIHGDLWGGNKGYAKGSDNGEVVPVIFDPATYYGDREADVAMTYLFGGFGSDFHRGYNDEWPLEMGHEKRRQVYNLYHILNHYVLFGGGYMNQARGMIDQILRM